MQKRLFLGFDVSCHWTYEPDDHQMISHKNRHVTMAFLGRQDVEKLLKALKTLSIFPFSISPAGFFDACLTMPSAHPTVIAWKMHVLTSGKALFAFHATLLKWLDEKKIVCDAKHKELFAHVTVSRNLEMAASWQEGFQPIPFLLTAFHLYESLGDSQYRKLWSRMLLPAFEEIEHVADMGYRIRGKTLRDVYLHAQLALAHYDPNVLKFITGPLKMANLDEIIYSLNQVLTKMDIEMGSPFKAISYHGNLRENEGVLEWEMIIDV